MVIRPCECTKTHQTVLFKRVNFMVHKFFLNLRQETDGRLNFACGPKCANPCLEGNACSKPRYLKATLGDASSRHQHRVVLALFQLLHSAGMPTVQGPSHTHCIRTVGVTGTWLHRTIRVSHGNTDMTKISAVGHRRKAWPEIRFAFSAIAELT